MSYDNSIPNAAEADQRCDFRATQQPLLNLLEFTTIHKLWVSRKRDTVEGFWGSLRSLYRIDSKCRVSRTYFIAAESLTCILVDYVSKMIPRAPLTSTTSVYMASWLRISGTDRCIVGHDFKGLATGQIVQLIICDRYAENARTENELTDHLPQA